MATARLAIATALFAAMTASASAQAPSYESRGYGGPLYVGPNFQEGGQHSPPVYGQGSSAKERPAKEHPRKRQVEQEPKERKARAAKDTDNDKAAAAERSAEPSKAENENSSISRAAAAEDKAPEVKSAGRAGAESENSSISEAKITTGTASQKATAANGTPDEPPVEPKTGQNVGCKKYFPWAGMTLTVPCESR
jgi:hypothetical protein